MLVLLCVLDKRRGDGGIIRDEALVIPALPKKGWLRLEVVGDWPVFDDGRVVRRNADPLSADFMSKVLDMIPEQLGLPGGDLETGSAESCQDFVYDTQVTPCIFGMDSRIVRVEEDFRGG